MATDDRIEAIIRAAIAGKPCTLPELTRASAPGVDVSHQRAVEVRAVDLASVYRQLAEDDGDGHELARRAEGNDESVISLIRQIAATAKALAAKETADGN